MIKNFFKKIFGREDEQLVVQDCSRPKNHDGPCNGWPCKEVREKYFPQTK